MDAALSLIFPAVGPTELIILLTIILLLFGAKKIPELAKGLGTGVREFRRGTRGEADEMKAHEGDRELSESEVNRDEETRPDGENVRTGHAGQKH